MRFTLIRPLLGLALVACQSTSAPRYIVTSAPIDVRGNTHGLCVAVDPTDPQGVWWWEPGRSGCSSRSSGVMRAERASVTTRAPSGAMNVRFRLQLIARSPAPEFADIELVLQDGGMRAVASGARVPTERRNTLELPEQPPYL